MQEKSAVQSQVVEATYTCFHIECNNIRVDELPRNASPTRCSQVTTAHRAQPLAQEDRFQSTSILTEDSLQELYECGRCTAMEIQLSKEWCRRFNCSYCYSDL
jgi:hypothetical protein